MYYKGKKLESYFGKSFKTKTSRCIEKINKPADSIWDARYAVGEQISHFGETIDDFKKRVLSMYSMNKGRKKGYKWVYVKAKMTIIGTTLPVYIPTIAEVSIPHNHIVFHGDYNKCRTDSATIERVIPIPEFICMRNARTRVFMKNNPYDSIDISPRIPFFIDISHTTVCNSIWDDVLKYGACKYIYARPDENVIEVSIDLDGHYDHAAYISNIDYDYTYSLYQLEHSQSISSPVGERIIVEDFDIMPVTCTRGFHFFEDIDHTFEYFNM